jgi:hypothetical protein
VYENRNSEAASFKVMPDKSMEVFTNKHDFALRYMAQKSIAVGVFDV